MSGTIPTSLGNLTNLTELLSLLLGNLTNQPVELRDDPDFAGQPHQPDGPDLWATSPTWSNQLSGTIPTSLGSLTNLTELYLNNNQLSGTIPASLGNLTNLHLYLWGTDPDLAGQPHQPEPIERDDPRLAGQPHQPDRTAP